jgi:hypothetical protein
MKNLIPAQMDVIRNRLKQVNDNAVQASLDEVLFFLDAGRKEPWTIRDAVKGTQIFGGIGSGKTSGSGKWIAKSFLSKGFGGIVLCGKPEEAEDWLNYAKETGRENDLIHFQEGSEWQFNPLQYEMTRPGKGAGQTSNITNLFMSIFRMGQRISGGGESQESERFWENSLRRCLNRTVDLLKLAGEEVSVYNMVELLNTAPEGSDTLSKISSMSVEEVEKWADENFCIRCLFRAGENKESNQQDRDFDLVYNYFLRDFSNLPEKTRSTVMEMFLGLAEPFLTGLLNDHFSKETNLTPEVTFAGKIIILDFPVKNYLEAGIYSQSIFKLLWQQATERRKVEENTAPVFLWVDESQYFINEYDMLFQTTARSSRACTVFLSQNISNYYAMMGGKNAEARVDSLLGNLSTKIYHANNDYKTNEWAANTIGKDFRMLGSVHTGEHPNIGSSQQLHYQVDPREFTILRTGGGENALEVEGIMTIAGKRFNNGKNFFKVIFNQNL